MNLTDIYESGAVKRYHGKRTLHNQTVADHCWGVATILMWLYYPDLPPDKSFQHALLHDAPELITGDVPAPAKWRSANLSQALADLEDAVSAEMGLPQFPHDPIVSFCDNAELAMHCTAQAMMGNRYMLRTARKGLERMKHWSEQISQDSVRVRAGTLINRVIKEIKDAS